MTIKKFLKLCENQEITNIQIVEFISKSLEVEYLNDKQKKNIAADETTYEIKAQINDKYVQLNTNYLSQEIIDLLIFKSQNIESNYQDTLITKKEKNSFVAPQDIYLEDTLSLGNYNSLKEKYKYVTDLELYYSIESTSKRIVNLHGLDISTTKTVKSFYCEASAKNKGNTYTYDDIVYVATNESINFKEIIENVLDKASKQVNPVKLPSDKYNVLLSSSFTSKILRESLSLYSKEEIRKKTSCLNNKLNKKIFSDKITIIEDPTNEKYPGYTKFDNEGTNTAYKEIVENGVLKTYLYNNKEAILENKESTGNNFGTISATNLYIKTGTTSSFDILKNIEDGLYITNYLESGGTMLNKTTGIISVQVFGFIIKNGKITKSFEPCILTTSIFDLFSNVLQISDSLAFKTLTVGSPELLVENMSISSN